jgi:2-keto-4-pentenoate hydratase
MNKLLSKTLCYALFTCAAIATSSTYAACLTDDQAVAMVDNFLDRKPAATPEAMSEADGVCSRAKFNNLIAMHMGKPVGYKAGLTNPAVQKRFNYDKPVRGTLYANMLLENGAVVDAAFGARALFEADLLVRIKDAEAIKNAKTPMDVLLAIDQIIPFIELPDLVVEAPPKLNGPAINAINVGARLGVMGKEIPVPNTRAERFAMLDGLRDMVVTVSDGAGPELGRGKGSDILEHPLNAVVWLVQDLLKENLVLKTGDLVSLGSFSPLFSPKAGLKVVVNYEGLPGSAPVSVSFR